MKKYYAKYLPVDGAIRQGDMVDVYVPVGEPPYNHEIIKVVDTNRSEGLAILEDNSSVGISFCSLVKLFICTDDISIGDRVMVLSDVHYWCHNSIKYCIGMSPDGFYQLSDDPDAAIADIYLGRSQVQVVVGLVSPGSEWVKHGDELTDADIEQDGGRILYFYKTLDHWSVMPDENYKYIKIKCPTCKTFH